MIDTKNHLYVTHAKGETIDEMIQHASLQKLRDYLIGLDCWKLFKSLISRDQAKDEISVDEMDIIKKSYAVGRRLIADINDIIDFISYN